MASRSSSRKLQQPLREINMIPLIDIMLVLLIIFMVTAPLLTHAVKVELPRAGSLPSRITKDAIQLAIRETGELWWNGESVDVAQIQQRLSAAAAATPVPELHIHADAQTPYHLLAKIMALASQAGLSNVGFVSVPETSSSSPVQR